MPALVTLVTVLTASSNPMTKYRKEVLRTSDTVKVYDSDPVHTMADARVTPNKGNRASDAPPPEAATSYTFLAVSVTVTPLPATTLVEGIRASMASSMACQLSIVWA